MKYVEPPHPRQEPRFAGELTGEHIRFLFRDCVDFGEREVLIGGDPEKRTRVFFIQGQVRGERLNDYVLRPLATSLALRAASPKSAARLMEEGTVYCQGVKRCRSLDQAVFAMVDGWAVFEFPGDGEMLAYFVGTEEKRAVSRPENEPSLKGAKDAFVESLRTNTSLVRRRLRAPELKITESVVGRQSVTPVDILYIEGLTDPALVKEVQRRVAGIDTDQAFQPSTLEELIVDEVDTAFPLLAYTERPDRFCAGLVEGRGGGHCGRAAAGVSAAGDHRAVLSDGTGPVPELAGGIDAVGAAIPLYALLPVSAGLVCGGGELSPGDDPGAAGLVDLGGEAERAVFDFV